MKSSEAFPSNWLHSEDLKDKRVAVTIEEVTPEERVVPHCLFIRRRGAFS